MRLLFLCVENSARSQMAEGIAKEILADQTIIESAGSNPSKISPLAIQVMKEIGIDISKQRSKSTDEIMNSNEIDWVITLCAEEICPFFGGKFQKVHWPFPNPNIPSNSEEQQLKLFREVRDGLVKKMNEFKKVLT